MKLLLIIDHFGSGGAQRQMVELACGLRCRGHAVEMFVYFPQHDFFRASLDEHQIVVHQRSEERGSSIGVLKRLAAVMRSGAFDVAVSFLSTANIYAELVSVVAPGTRLVVSERTSFHDDKSAIGAFLRRLLHLLSDRVVANSETQAAWLRSRPWLRNSGSCIYNGVDLRKFQRIESAPKSGTGLRLLGVGRIGPEKNLINLITALSRFEEKFGYVPEVDWAGQRDSSRNGRRYCRRLDALLESLPSVRRSWRWLGLQSDIPRLLHEYHALIHPSLYEGLPNAVCEALAAGVPVLASNVCDHPLLVAEGYRGYLFDPRDPAGIAAAIAKLAKLDVGARRNLERNAREYALANLGVDKMVDSYAALFRSLLAGRKQLGNRILP
jgi:glycosyltransferase involved in cell wall biosynthesis